MSWTFHHWEDKEKNCSKYQHAEMWYKQQANHFKWLLHFFECNLDWIKEKQNAEFIFSFEYFPLHLIIEKDKV